MTSDEACENKHIVMMRCLSSAGIWSHSFRGTENHSWKKKKGEMSLDGRFLLADDNPNMHRCL